MIRKILNRIRNWFWWNFKATEEEKTELDTQFKGIGIMKDGKRIDPNKFYKP